MFWIVAEGNRKPEPDEMDPAKLAQLLEIELMQKRAAWQRSRSGIRNLRVLSFLFLFLVIIGALAAFYLLFTPERVSELKAGHDASPTPSATVSR
jgi:hypothetical protein